MHHAGIVPALFLHLVTVDAVQPHAGGIGAMGVAVIERGRIALGVPFLARGDASLAAHASIEIDDEAKFFLIGLRSWQRSH